MLTHKHRLNVFTAEADKTKTHLCHHVWHLRPQLVAAIAARPRQNPLRGFLVRPGLITVVKWEFKMTKEWGFLCVILI